MEQFKIRKHSIVEIITSCSISAFNDFFRPLTKAFAFFKKYLLIREDIILLKEDLLKTEKKLERQHLDLFKKVSSLSEEIDFLRDEILQQEKQIILQTITCKDTNFYSKCLKNKNTPIKIKKDTNKWNLSLKDCIPECKSDECSCISSQE
ncbi:MAG: hypothetical protein D3920_09250 [Candidatus Electrothrix sp. AW2]|nr:hypothetical protein [Candidatus Electrothrix gigas]